MSRPLRTVPPRARSQKRATRSTLDLLGVLEHVVGAARHEECLLRILVEFAGDQPLERRDRLLELDVLALDARELLRDREGLRHEALKPPRTTHNFLVILGQLIHAENRDDVLELLVALQ